MQSGAHLQPVDRSRRREHAGLLQAPTVCEDAGLCALRYGESSVITCSRRMMTVHLWWHAVGLQQRQNGGCWRSAGAAGELREPVHGDGRAGRSLDRFRMHDAHALHQPARCEQQSAGHLAVESTRLREGHPGLFCRCAQRQRYIAADNVTRAPTAHENCFDCAHAARQTWTRTAW
eukprot:SAG25_NODE_1142_length_3812_cov_1.523027_4_plen_176_part_00